MTFYFTMGGTSTDLHAGLMRGACISTVNVVCIPRTFNGRIYQKLLELTFPIDPGNTKDISENLDVRLVVFIHVIIDG